MENLDAARRGVVLATLASIALLLGVTSAAAAPPAGGTEVVPGEAIARFEPVDARARAAAIADVGGDWGSRVEGVPGTRRVELPPEEAVGEAVRALRRQPGVRWAEPNYIVELEDVIPDDPLFPDLWGLWNTGQEVQGVEGVAGIDVGAPIAWEATTGSGSVRVAIVDSGIDSTHPDLQANLNGGLGRNFVPAPNTVVDPDAWSDANSHGTHVAGTVGAVGDNGLGVAGVAWDAELVAARVCMTSGACTTAALAEGLAYAGEIGARVANASVGTPHSFATKAAIAAHPKTLYVAAAGNDGADVDAAPTYPCSFSSQDNVVCVAAIDQSGGLAGFSNYGTSTVGLGAPGVNVRSTVPQLEQRFDGSEDELEPWKEDPAGRWFFEAENEAIEFDDVEKPLPAESALTTDEPLDLSGGSGCRLAYQLALDTTEDQQTLHVDASSDGVTWIPIESQLGGYSGSTGEKFVPVTDELTAFDGEPNVLVRYRLTVTAVAQGEDAIVAIRAPKVTCVGPQPPGGAYSYLDGTSMASPHVAGVAALAFAAHPGAGVAEVRDALLDTAVPTPSLAGRTVTGGRVNASAVLAALRAAPAQPVPAPVARREPRGWALTLLVRRRIPVSGAGKARVRLRCRALRTKQCRGRLALVGRARRGERGRGRRMVLGARQFGVPKGRHAVRPIWLRPRAARLLRRGRIRAVRLRLRTRQPAGARPRVRGRTARAGLRPQRRRG